MNNSQLCFQTAHSMVVAFIVLLGSTPGLADSTGSETTASLSRQDRPNIADYSVNFPISSRPANESEIRQVGPDSCQATYYLYDENLLSQVAKIFYLVAPLAIPLPAYALPGYYSSDIKRIELIKHYKANERMSSVSELKDQMKDPNFLSMDFFNQMKPGDSLKIDFLSEKTAALYGGANVLIAVGAHTWGGSTQLYIEKLPNQKLIYRFVPGAKNAENSVNYNYVAGGGGSAEIKKESQGLTYELNLNAAGKSHGSEIKPISREGSQVSVDNIEQFYFGFPEILFSSNSTMNSRQYRDSRQTGTGKLLYSGVEQSSVRESYDKDFAGSTRSTSSFTAGTYFNNNSEGGAPKPHYFAEAILTSKATSTTLGELKQEIEGLRDKWNTDLVLNKPENLYRLLPKGDPDTELKSTMLNVEILVDEDATRSLIRFAKKNPNIAADFDSQDLRDNWNRIVSDLRKISEKKSGFEIPPIYKSLGEKIAENPALFSLITFAAGPSLKYKVNILSDSFRPIECAGMGSLVEWMKNCKNVDLAIPATR